MAVLRTGRAGSFLPPAEEYTITTGCKRLILRYLERQFTRAGETGASMRAVVQRVTRARVVIDGEVVGEIGKGLLVLLGIARSDTSEQARWLADKIVSLRVFEDAEGKMNRG